jgi:hypothetical protein
VDAEAALDEALADVSDEVSGNGVHANHGEGEGECALLFEINDPGEGGEIEEADAT